MAIRKKSSRRKRETPTESSEHPGSLSSRLMQAQDDERRRISRELHDTVGQSLSAIKMVLHSLEKDRQDQSGLKDCLSIVEQTITEVRTISYLLHPPTLDLLGLCSAIEWYAEGFSKRSGIQLDISLPQLPRLAPEYETTIFRVLQECLTNTHRHANASRVQICLRANADELKLVVKDNGQGIEPRRLADPLAFRGALGVGISGMHERLRQFGGRLEIKSSKRRTKVSAVPISGRRLIGPERNLASPVAKSNLKCRPW